MQLIKPPRLNVGDRVGIITPASAPANPALVDSALEAVTRLGFNPLLGRHVRKRRGFLAGTDRERAADLMTMFGNRDVKGIFCLRGGYGSSRLLPLLDYSFIRRHPKLVAGYSDITSLHCAFNKMAGVVSLHGPMPGPEFSKQDLPPFTTDGFLRTTTLPFAAGGICQDYGSGKVTALAPGKASGRLIGGNLTLLCASLGTWYQPSFAKRILFFEEIDEEPYRVDRLLTQLLNAGSLRQVSGVAIGFMRNCKDPKVAVSREYRQTVEDVLKERLANLGVPVVCGLPFGHHRFNATIPVGIRATLDASVPDLVITEAAVS